MRPQRGSRATSSIGAKTRETPSRAASAAAARAVRGPERGIEGAGFGERNGKYGSVPMQHVEADQQGDAEPALLHGDALRGANRSRRPKG